MRKLANKKKGKSEPIDKTVSSNEQENGEPQQTETESEAKKIKSSKKVIPKEDDAEESENDAKKIKSSKKVISKEEDTEEPESDAKKIKSSKKVISKEENTDEPADSVPEKKRKRATKSDETAAEEELDEEYEVETIVASKLHKGKRQFKIRWKGYGEDGDTWEYEDSLSCPEIIEAYLKENPDEAPSKSQKRGKQSKEKEVKKKKTAATDDDSEQEAGESVYEVQKIMEVRFKKNGKKEFLVHWKGFQHKYDSWEPEEHLSCPELIKGILERAEKAKELPARVLRADPKQTKRLTLTMQQQGRRLSRRNQGKERATYATSFAT